MEKVEFNPSKHFVRKPRVKKEIRNEFQKLEDKELVKKVEALLFQEVEIYEKV